MSEHTKKLWQKRHRHDMHSNDFQLAVVRIKKEVKYANN